MLSAPKVNLPLVLGWLAEWMKAPDCNPGSKDAGVQISHHPFALRVSSSSQRGLCGTVETLSPNSAVKPRRRATADWRFRRLPTARTDCDSHLYCITSFSGQPEKLHNRAGQGLGKGKWRRPSSYQGTLGDLHPGPGAHHRCRQG